MSLQYYHAKLFAVTFRVCIEFKFYFFIFLSVCEFPFQYLHFIKYKYACFTELGIYIALFEKVKLCLFITEYLPT